LRIGLLVWSFAFVGVFGTLLPAASPEIRVVTQVLYGGSLALWAALRLGRARGPLDLPILVFLLSLLVASLLSRDMLGSLNMLGGGLAFALLFWLMADVRSATHRGSIALGVTGAITAWLVTFAIRWSLEKVDWVANGGGMPNLLESAQTLFWLTTNAVPMLTLVGLGFIGYLPRGAGSRVLSGAFIVASAITVPMSGGRAAWLGLGAAALVWYALRSGRARSVLTTRRILVAAAAVAAIPFLVTALGVTGPYVTGLSARLPLWTEAVAIFAADPLSGGGPGTFAWLRLEHIPAYHVPVPAMLAHNVAIQTLADGGLLLLAGFALAAGWTLSVMWQRRHELSERDRRTVAVLVGFAVASLLDDHSSLPAITAMVVTLVAWVTTSPADDPRPAGRWHRAAMYAVVGLIAIVALPAVARVDLGRLDAAAGRAAITLGDVRGGGAAFSSAADWYPANAQYHLSLGLALAMDGRDDDARASYQRAADLAPGDARAWGGLAELAADESERRALLSIAAARPTSDPQFAYRLGAALEAEDRLVEAQQAYAHAVARLPSLILTLQPGTAPTSRSGVAEAALRTVQELGADARLSADQTAWDLALAGVETQARLPLAWQAVVAIQQDKLEAADAALRQAIANDRWAPQTWRVARALAEVSCDSRSLNEAVELLGLLPGGRTAPDPHVVQRAPDLPYREEGLGDYQPIESTIPPRHFEWPGAYLEPTTRC
jgi:tetratricopeptide (TPR) repeat protein/O-antigen ligase